MEELVCSLCLEEFDAVLAPAGVRCTRDAASHDGDTHFVCGDCVGLQIKAHLDNAKQTTLPLDEASADVCCVGVECNGVWKLSDVVPHLTPETLVRFITARDGVVKMRAKIDRLTAKVTASAATPPSPALFEEILRLTLRSEGAVYQCRECKHGPVQHVHCGNLLTHHKKKGIDNSCAFCGVEPRGTDLTESYEEWDGTFAPEYFPLQRRERGQKRAWEESASPRGVLGKRAALGVAAPAADPRWRCPGAECNGGPLLMPGTSCFKCARPDPELRNIECRAFRRNHDAVLLPALEHVARCADICDEHYNDTLRGFPRFESALAERPVPTCGAEVVDALSALGIDALSPAVFTLLRPLLQIENRCVEGEFAKSGIPIVIALRTKQPLQAARERVAPLDGIGIGVVFRAAKIHVCTPAQTFPSTLDANCTIVGMYDEGLLPVTLDADGAIVGMYNEGLLAMDAHAFERFLAVPGFAALVSPAECAAARGAFAAGCRAVAAAAAAPAAAAPPPPRCVDEALVLKFEQWHDIAAMAYFLHTINADYCVARDAYHSALSAGINDLCVAFPRSKHNIKKAYTNWLSNSPASSHATALAKVQGQPEGVLSLWIDELVKQTPSKRMMIARLSATEAALKDEARCLPRVLFDYNASLCAGVNGLAMDPRREGPNLDEIKQMKATFGMRKAKKEVCRSHFSATIERFNERIREEKRQQRRSERDARRARHEEERWERTRQLTMRELPLRYPPHQGPGRDEFYDGYAEPTLLPAFDMDMDMDPFIGGFEIGREQWLPLAPLRASTPPMAPPMAPPMVPPMAQPIAPSPMAPSPMAPSPMVPPTRPPQRFEVAMNLEGVGVPDYEYRLVAAKTSR